LNPLDRPKAGSIGKLLPGVEARIEEDGELMLRSPCLFSGYYRDPEATAAVLRAQLAEIRIQAIATEHDEAVLGESSIAAPIFDRSGGSAGAIAVVGDSERVFPRGPARGLATAVVEAARGASRELGAVRWPFEG